MASDERNGGSAAVAAGVSGDTNLCVICNTVVHNPYKTLLGGGVICSEDCYQKHLESDDESNSNLYWFKG